MTESKPDLSNLRPRTPRGAAIAGIIFAVLFGISQILVLLSLPEISSDRLEWLGAGTVSLALTLVPFAGIAFLWFLGVVRERLGELEDQFFSTLLLGSALLYLAMIFIAASIAGALLTIYAFDPGILINSGVYTFARILAFNIHSIYAVRMSGMFMIVSGIIWIRTRTMPRWLSFITFILALVLLISIGFTIWITLIFPAWVFLVSVYILILNYRYQDKDREKKDSLTLDD
ncbi:hypothetical protein ACFLQ6_06610 [Thermoproteota archaeon]